MSVRRVCDRCGKVLGEHGSHKICDRRLFWPKEYDLCNECYMEFEAWMKTCQKESTEEPVWDSARGEFV